MGDKCVPREDKFVFKIPDFWKKKNKNKESKVFRLGKYNCYLEVGKIADYEISECFNVYLTAERSKEFVNFKGFCKLCLIDGRHEEFLVMKRTTLKFKTSFQFMNIMTSDLDDLKFDLVPKNVLTLRLTWCDEENSSCEWDTQLAPYLISEKEQRKLLKKFSKDFGRIYVMKEDTDFTLTVGSEKMELHVHHALLSARSNVFAEMFRQAISKDLDNVDIPDVDAIVLSDVLYYVYSGKTRSMSADTIVPMYEVAKKYSLNELMDACLNILMHSLTVENVCDAARLAYTRGKKKLEEKTVQFVKEKWDEIKQNHKWQELSKSEPTLADKLTPST